MFADLSGFTALTEVHGDEDADIVAGFFEATRALLRGHGGEEVKTLGDAMMIRCDAMPDAIGLALRIVQEVGSRHGFPSVRVGLHAGPAVQRGHDWFGATVNLAARISAAAAGGEVLLSEAAAASTRCQQPVRKRQDGANASAGGSGALAGECPTSANGRNPGPRLPCRRSRVRIPSAALFSACVRSQQA
ncbi:MAG: adenylate/guanylate cyclase domain-containing protein [Thermoleophilaceae bacterium]